MGVTVTVTKEEGMKRVRKVAGPIAGESISGPTERIVWQDKQGNYLVTSSVEGIISETMVFRATKEGEIVGYQDLGGSEPGDHAGALGDAGYIIEEG